MCVTCCLKARSGSVFVFPHWGMPVGALYSYIIFSYKALLSFIKHLLKLGILPNVNKWLLTSFWHYSFLFRNIRIFDHLILCSDGVDVHKITSAVPRQNPFPHQSHHELEYPHSHCFQFHLPHQALLIQQLQVLFHPKKKENEYKNLRIRWSWTRMLF